MTDVSSGLTVTNPVVLDGEGTQQFGIDFPRRPEITTQPTDQTVAEGGSVTFTVAVDAVSATPLSYQWMKNGTNIAGATTNVYAINNVQAANAGSYSVRVTNVAGNTNSASAALTVLGPVRILTLTPASSLTVTQGQTATFSVTAGGTPPLSYQWKKGGVGLPGENSDTLVIPNAQLSDAGSYSVSITNVVSATNSSSITFTVLVPPFITTQPAGLTVTQGQSATFSVVAAGTAPLSYQWQRNGTNIAGATAASYALTNVQPTAAGDYGVRISNSAGSTNSTAATLIVLEPPFIVSQPSSLIATQGQSATFTVSATGTQPLTYQWRKGGALLTDQTNTTLTLPNVQAADAGSYDVLISNSVGATNSTAAQLDVRIPPAILAQPQSAAVTPGNTVQFSVVAAGTATLSYQWQKNGTNLSGQTNATLTLQNVQTNDAGDYAVRVCNGVGCTNSQTATLLVVNRALRIGSTNTTPGGTVGLPISLVAVGNENRATFSLALNTNALSVSGVILGVGASGATLVTSNRPNGDLYVEVTLPGGTTFSAGANELAVVNLTVIDSTPTNAAVISLELDPDLAQVAAADGTPLPFDLLNGSLTVTPAGPVAIAPDRGTGLFEEHLKLAVPSSGLPANSAFLVLVYDLGNDSLGRPIQVYNQAGTTNGVPYLRIDGPLPGGTLVDLLIQFIVLDRKTVPAPRYVVVKPPYNAPTEPTGPTTAIKPEWIKLVNGVAYLQFNSAPSRTYFVQYKDALGDPWKTAYPALAGNGSWVVWVDTGPPKTSSLPDSSRYYQVREAQ